MTGERLWEMIQRNGKGLLPEQLAEVAGKILAQIGIEQGHVNAMWAQLNDNQRADLIAAIDLAEQPEQAVIQQEQIDQADKV